MDEYSLEIKKLLQPLSFEQKLAFCALTAEKLLHNYSYFSQQFKWGSPEILQKALLVIFQSISNKNLFSKLEIQEFIDNVDSITPDTEDFDTILVSFALDGCTSVLSSLYYLQDQENEHTIDVAIYARDTVHMYLQEIDDLDMTNEYSEQKIENNLLMKLEKYRQKEIINRLSKTTLHH